jgi:DNA-binding SARP family transcriptional activator/predicted ATPase
MSLRIFLLGQFALRAGDQPLTLSSRPAQSLLAYLALNAGVTQRREKLAGLLWPEATESNARSYLRQALWRARKSLTSGALDGDAYLQSNDIEVVFNRHADYWLDAELLLQRSPQWAADELMAILRLYQGELLPGFYDEWVELERDRLRAAFQQKMHLLLDRLSAGRRWDEVLTWGERWIRLGHSPEPAYRALMAAYGGLGDQGMIDATYQRCVEALRRDLDVGPSPETEQLANQLRHGATAPPAGPPAPARDPAAGRPSFLAASVSPAVETQVFVARERELARLGDFLQATLSGKGRVAFVAGEVGAGKTALVHEFVRRMQAAHADLIVALGNCNAHTGSGDPYLPFREMMGLLSGDVEAQWAAGALTRDHAFRLWHTLPLTAQALVKVGPGLIDTFLAGRPLTERALTYAAGRADWVTELEQVAARSAGGALAHGLEQRALFHQITSVLHFLAGHAPLMLVIDDLQWADPGSISLLFHLCRQLTGSRILVVGIYRPEEVAMPRDGLRHPLQTVLNEAQRHFGDILVNVDAAAGRDFVDAILDSEPNRLGVDFRQMLYRQTRGQPLFTVELLRGMQERGDLHRDPGGCWVTGSQLDWETLPARVEAVIAERIGRLSGPMQATLRVASVEGETFTAEVVAQVRASNRQETLERLSAELDRRHRLVRAQSIVRAGDQLLSRYRFRHILFQKYLYGTLDEVERVHLHEQVGTALEGLAGSDEAMPALALQLARHFEEARLPEQAIHFLHLAGQRALQLSAYKEAITHLTRGLALLSSVPDTAKRARLELTLQLALGIAWMGPRGYGPEVMSAQTRAGELCRQLADKPQLCRVQGELAVYCFVRGEFSHAHELAQETLTMAQETGDPLLIAIAHWHLGFISLYLGEFVTARAHLAHVLSFYEPRQHHHDLVRVRGSDAGSSAIAFEACCLWALGFPDQAVERSREALALARQFDHPFSLADVLCFGGCVLGSMRGDIGTLRESARELMQISNTRQFAGWIDAGNSFYGEALARSGQVAEGIARLQEGLAGSEVSGVRCQQVSTLRSLSAAQGQAGELAEALRTLQKALDLVEQSGERFWEVELHRLRGELLLTSGDAVAAEDSWRKALAVARHQQVKSWELRAANNLARLWQQQGKGEAARQLLQPIYAWFSEGFATADLQEARDLLAGG